MQTVTLGISGMTCGGCVRSVNKVLNALDWVAKSEGSLEERRAVVDFDADRVGVDQLKHAIEEAGYEVAG